MPGGAQGGRCRTRPEARPGSHGGWVSWGRGILRPPGRVGSSQAEGGNGLRVRAAAGPPWEGWLRCPVRSRGPRSQLERQEALCLRILPQRADDRPCPGRADLGGEATEPGTVGRASPVPVGDILPTGNPVQQVVVKQEWPSEGRRKGLVHVSVLRAGGETGAAQGRHRGAGQGTARPQAEGTAPCPGALGVVRGSATAQQPICGGHAPSTLPAPAGTQTPWPPHEAGHWATL